MSDQPRTPRKYRRHKQHPNTPLGQVLNKYDLPLSTLHNWLTEAGEQYASTSTLSRLVNGKGSPQWTDRLNTIIAARLRDHMIQLGETKASVDAQLLEVFTEGEYQPMISKRIALRQDEISYFGLTDDPFKNYPSSRDEVFISRPLREIYDAVLDAIKYRHFVAVIGPIGSGKTTLRALIEDHVAGDENLHVIWPEFFDQKNVSPIEIARTILRETDTPAPQRATALGAAVKAKLSSMTQNGKRVALAIDECHRMNKSAVSSLKNFFEMSSGGFQKYLGIVLLGWPSFVSTLEMPEFQEIYERIHVLEMPPFQDQAAGYLAHRLRLVGKKVEDLFDDEAVTYIAANAETPLGLGNIANQALRISKEKYDNTRVIGAALKNEMIFENKVSQQGWRKR